jgi:hypothetical protein
VLCLGHSKEAKKAFIRELEQTVAHNRSKLVENANEHPHLAAVAAYDAITELLLAAVKELQELRRT